MNSFTLSPTGQTPEIIFDPNGNFKIAGRLMTSFPAESVQTVDKWIDDYISAPADKTCVHFYVEYASTHSIKFLISLLKKIKSVILKQKECMIYWHYEEDDYDILEKGEDISVALEHPVKFVKI